MLSRFSRTTDVGCEWLSLTIPLPRRTLPNSFNVISAGNQVFRSMRASLNSFVGCLLFRDHYFSLLLSKTCAQGAR